MSSTRNERRRRWFLRTWAASGWLNQWRDSVRALTLADPGPADTSPHARQWAKFAADNRVPMGVVLQVHRRDTNVTVSLPLTDPYVLIGNSPCCGLRLDDPSLRGMQYGLFWLNGELYGVDLRPNDPNHDDPIPRDGWWTDGQSLRLGDYTLWVRGLPGIPARTSLLDDNSTITLHRTSPTGVQQRPITRWLTLIGCGVEDGVFIPEANIAPRQAALIRTPASLWLVNLAEALPPRITNRPIRWSQLDPLDEFTFGESTCHLTVAWPDALPPLTEFADDPAEATPSREDHRARVAALQAELDRLLSLSEVAQ